MYVAGFVSVAWVKRYACSPHVVCFGGFIRSNSVRGTLVGKKMEEDKFENPIEVGDFVAAVKRTVDTIFETVPIAGEISKITVTYSGHAYFTMKDEDVAVSCVMFKSSFNKLDFDVEEGCRYVIYAKPSIYDKRGEFQLNVYDMIEEGEGVLSLKFEKLKNKLNKKGYFDIDRKKELPEYPKTVGIATSPKAAALQDILSVSKHRASSIDIIIYPCLVQGVDAPKSVASVIELANKRKEVDVLIVTRGGGSSEDLSAFNDELVANAIYKSRLPIVSAVGHEIDLSIADMVADVRAQTPTAAVELVFPNLNAIAEFVRDSQDKLIRILEARISHTRDKLERYSVNYMATIVENKHEVLKHRHESIEANLYSNIKNMHEAKNQKFLALVDKMNILNPLNTLLRGYSRTTKDDVTVSSINSVVKGDTIETQVSDGKIKSTITDIE